MNEETQKMMHEMWMAQAETFGVSNDVAQSKWEEYLKTIWEVVPVGQFLMDGDVFMRDGMRIEVSKKTVACHTQVSQFGWDQGIRFYRRVKK